MNDIKQTSLGKVFQNPHYIGLCFLGTLPAYLWYPLNIFYFVGGALLTIAVIWALYQKVWPSYLSTQKHMLRYAKVCFATILIFWLINGPLKIYQLRFHWFDIGSFSIPIVNMAYDGNYYNSLMKMPALADHFCPILLVFTPLFKIWPSVLWLYWAKIIAHFAAVWLLYRFAVKEGLNNLGLALILVLGACSKYIGLALNYEFQPSSLALPLVVLGLQYIYRKQYGLAIVCLLGMLLFKESMVLVWLVAGAYTCIENKDRILGIFMVIAGLGIGILLTKVVMPSLNHGVLHHDGAISLTEQIPNKINSIVGLYLLLGIPTLLNPKYIMYGLPTFGLILLGSNIKPTMATLNFHYHDIAYVAVGFFAVVAYLNRLVSIEMLIHKLKYAPAAFVGLVMLSSDYFPSRTYMETDWQMAQKLAYNCQKANDFLKEKKARGVAIPTKLISYFINIPYASDYKNAPLSSKQMIVHANCLENTEELQAFEALIANRKDYQKQVFDEVTVYY